MTAKRRHSTSIDLGTLGPQDYTPEIDLSSFTHAVLYVTLINRGSAVTKVSMEASPTPHGTAADWYSIYSPMSLSSGLSTNYINNLIVPNPLASDNGIVNGEKHAMPVGFTYDSGAQFNVDYVMDSFPLPRRMRFRNAEAANGEIGLVLHCIRSVG